MASFREANIGSLNRSPTITRICFSVVNCFGLRNVISCHIMVVIQLFSTRSCYICRTARTRSFSLTSRITLSELNDDALETRHPGEMPVETDEGEGRASRWNTLRALRVLNWYSAETNSEA